MGQCNWCRTRDLVEKDFLPDMSNLASITRARSVCLQQWKQACDRNKNIPARRVVRWTNKRCQWLCYIVTDKAMSEHLKDSIKSRFKAMRKGETQ